MATVKDGPRWTRLRHAGRVVGSSDWVIDLDIKGFFDNIPQERIPEAVAHHTDLGWVLLYVKRWLGAPVQQADGSVVERDKGTPQGAPVAPPTQVATSSSR
jgi:retron-type reverse transcriptase